MSSQPSKLDSLLANALARPAKNTKRTNDRNEAVDVDLTRETVDAVPAAQGKKRKQATITASLKSASKTPA